MIELSLKLLLSYVSVTVSKGVSYAPRLAWIELLCCSTVATSLARFHR